VSNAFNWVCHFCRMPQTVDSNASIDDVSLGATGSKFKEVGCRVFTIACANQECLELFAVVSIHKWQFDGVRNRWGIGGDELFELGRRPSSTRSVQPNYISPAIVQDYYEACDILLLSPKASATLSRRCLQGMIRDFCGISKNRLIDEIAELTKQADAGNAPAGVQPDIIEAIDAVRKIGNIGAHMEKDINVIVDVDPDEAKTLVELLELLFREWYVARHDRRQRIAAIGAIAAAKDAQKQLPPPAG
jgi:hypothetical protein